MKRSLIIISLFLLSVLTSYAQYDKDVFYFRGRTALSDGKYALAIENFNILANLDKDDYWTFFFRGIAKYNLGDIRGSFQDFDTSVKINPVFTNGYHYRAIALSQLGRYDEAFKDFDRAVELRPGYDGLYFSRGVTYFLSQQFDKAVKDFDRYIRKEPNDPSAYLNRGASYLYLKDTTKALEDYNMAIRLDRFEAESYIRRGRLYSSQGRYDEAIEDMNKSIELDSSNTVAYFYRALMYYDKSDFNKAMADLNRVLKDDPGNALTLYNRSLISAQVGDFQSALADMDRVININPNNVLAYYNRASFFVEMGRWRDALEDYDKTIELYPDFAKAYMNRSYVTQMLGLTQQSKDDYETAQRKVAEYRAKNLTDEGSFADTTAKYSSLLAFDAAFARKDFDNELLQHRDIDIHLRPLYRIQLTDKKDDTMYALADRYENRTIDRFVAEASYPMAIATSNEGGLKLIGNAMEHIVANEQVSDDEESFIRGLYELQNKQYNTALNHFDDAIDYVEDDGSSAMYYMNRAVLKAEMIDFIASIQSNVQTLTMDDRGNTRARVRDHVNTTYDYSEAIEDLKKAVEIAPDVAYLHYNLGNLYCLSSQLVNSIESYDEAISLYPSMADAYYNRGLVLIFLKDKERGCIDLSTAGSLGLQDAYGVISKYCEEND